MAPVPFEDLEAMPGFWKRVGAMFGLAFTRPNELFQRVPATEDLWAPLRFQFLLATPMILLMVVLSLFMGLFFKFLGPEAGSNQPPGWIGPLVGAFYAVFLPICILVGYFLGGAILHALLWIWGGLKEGRELAQSMRLVGYVMAFGQLAAMVPCLNYFVPLLMPIPLGIGLARVHRTETWRGICAAYTPLVLAALLVAVILGLVLALK